MTRVTAARGADEWVADLQLEVPGRRLLAGEGRKKCRMQNDECRMWSKLLNPFRVPILHSAFVILHFL